MVLVDKTANRKASDHASCNLIMFINAACHKADGPENTLIHPQPRWDALFITPHLPVISVYLLYVDV